MGASMLEWTVRYLRARTTLRTRASRWLVGASYVQKWLVLGILIGVIAGLGAVVFYEALVLATHFFLGTIGGYQTPSPAGEGARAASASFTRPWAIPLIACVGALGGALLVFWFAPEAAGHGTDAAIDAVHHNPRGIRIRTVIVKIVASALTIGSGGSGGREGPTGQISAGFGSFLARYFDLSPSDARIAVASGIGSGIGSIFGAPLGGSVLATEIMYRDDFEVEALLPAFIASIAGYVVFGAIEGYGPLFGYVANYHLTDPVQLVWFAVIGILGGLVGLLYSKVFYAVSALFQRSSIPRWVRPAIGGLLVGCMALAIPEVLGTGYGWIQVGLSARLLHIPLWIVLLLPLARILATSLSIGSGGSGGIFGPGMVIGAFIGAAVWRVMEPLASNIGHDPAPYVIVGMMCCFGSISRAPLAVMLMVAEMTGSMSMLVPAMVAVGLATLIVRRTDDTIYRSQPRSRAESPAHRILAGLPLLATIRADQAMAEPRCVLAVGTDVPEGCRELASSDVDSAPVVDAEGYFVGIVTMDSLQRGLEDENVGDYVNVTSGSVRGDALLNIVLETVTSTPQTWAPVLDEERRLVGTIAISDIVRGYRRALLANLRKLSAVVGPSGASDIVIREDSPLVGASLRSSSVPRGLLVTSIERNHEVFVPDGSVLLRSGDRMVVLGASSDLEHISELANGQA
jgi:CIC family chloride channel protein